MVEIHETVATFGEAPKLRNVAVTEIKVTTYDWMNVNDDELKWPDHRTFMRTAESRAEFLGLE